MVAPEDPALSLMVVSRPRLLNGLSGSSSRPLPGVGGVGGFGVGEGEISNRNKESGLDGTGLLIDANVRERSPQ
jgi:hypothetical protein